MLELNVESSKSDRGRSALTVAICIGTYNQVQYLRGSVESALAQTYPIQEIWVSDDASCDGTDAAMREICDQYPQIRYFRQPVNLGLSGNISWLLSQPQTDLIVRLDSDNSLEPDYVAVLAKLMEQYPVAGYAHCDVTEIDGDDVVRRFRRLARTSTYESSEETLKRTATGYRVAANCILYRATAIAEVGYYRPTPTWNFCEDWHMVIRLAAKGWGNVYVPQVLTSCRVWDDAMGIRASRRMAEVRNTKDIYETLLIPEYNKRGWPIAPLKKNMRARAVQFVDALDSERFSQQNREAYKLLLRELGDSWQLSLAIFLAGHGLNPLFRSWTRVRIAMKDIAKTLIRKLSADSLKS